MWSTAISLRENNRPLIIVEDKAKVLEMEAIFENWKAYWFGGTEYMIGAIWNMIKIIFLVESVLIGTPNKLGEMFTTAG
jgi:hypothetical protein